MSSPPQTCGRVASSLSGLTLIELLIVVTVVGILFVFSYPAYQDYASRSKRSEAASALLKIATQQERYYLQHQTFTRDLSRLGFPVSDGFVTDSGAYGVSIRSASHDYFEAEARYLRGDSELKRCAVMRIDAAQVRTSAPSSRCWSGR